MQLVAQIMDISTEKTPEHTSNQPRQHVILGARQLSPARHFAKILKARRKLTFKVEVRPPENTTVKTLQQHRTSS